MSIHILLACLAVFQNADTTCDQRKLRLEPWVLSINTARPVRTVKLLNGTQNI